jgi:hypothetical protein
MMLQNIWQFAGTIFGLAIAGLLVISIFLAIIDGYLSYRNRNKNHFDKTMGMYVNSRDRKRERQAIGGIISTGFIAAIVYFAHIAQ